VAFELAVPFCGSQLKIYYYEVRGCRKEFPEYLLDQSVSGNELHTSYTCRSTHPGIKYELVLIFIKIRRD
jgi:hypothetical protein